MKGRFKMLAALLVAALLNACSNDTPIKIGFIGGLTGRFADLGTSGRNGAIIAVDWRNARGGINGRPVILLIRDDEQQGDRARQALRSLLTDNVLAIVGPMTSSMASEILPLADETKTVLVGGTIVSDRFSGKNDYLIRVISDTSEYSAQTARQIENINPSESTAVFYDVANRDYSEDWAKNYALEANRLGNHKVSLHAFDSRKPEAAPAVANAVFSASVSAPSRIVLVCNSRDAAAIARVARQRAPQVHLTASAWAATEQLLEDGKTYVEGMILQEYYNVDESGETFRTFAGEFTQRFGRKPDYASIVAFDATNVLLDALETHPNRDGLREAILDRGQFSGLTGLITLDVNGDAFRPNFAAVVKNGRFVALPDTP